MKERPPPDGTEGRRASGGHTGGAGTVAPSRGETTRDYPMKTVSEYAA